MDHASKAYRSPSYFAFGTPHAVHAISEDMSTIGGAGRKKELLLNGVVVSSSINLIFISMRCHTNQQPKH